MEEDEDVWGDEEFEEPMPDEEDEEPSFGHEEEEETEEEEMKQSLDPGEELAPLQIKSKDIRDAVKPPIECCCIVVPSTNTTLYLADLIPKVARPGTTSPVFLTGKDRKTSPIMTRFERANIIALRSHEIETGKGKVDERVASFVKESGITNSLDIAELELEDLKSPHPIIILRPLDKETYEVWPVRDLILRSQLVTMSYSHEATVLMEVYKTKKLEINQVFKKYEGTLDDF